MPNSGGGSPDVLTDLHLPHQTAMEHDRRPGAEPGMDRTGAWDYELVIVTYRSREPLRRMLDQLPQSLPIVVVDNARGEDDIPDLLSDRPAARYLDAGGGLGFARAANLGARTSTYRYLVFGNPDSLPTVAVHRALIEHLRSDPSVGACAAGTVDEGGVPELGVGGWEPTWWRALAHALGVHKLFPSVGIWARPRRRAPMELEWLSGACFAVERQRFLQHGGFDERYFVYNEDMALGRRLRRAGFRHVLRADLSVPHVGAGSGDSAATMMRHRGASMSAYLHDHNAPLRALVVRALLCAGYLLRILGRWATGDRKMARLHVAWLRGLVSGRG